MPYFRHGECAAQSSGFGVERNLMLDAAFRHDVWTRLEPNLRGSTTIDGYLQAAADMTGDVIEVVGSYSLCTSLYGSPITVGTSDRTAWEADQVEFDTEDGPCVEALRTCAVVTGIDLATESRWPAWAAIATLLGFASAAGIPAEVSRGHRIALNLYAHRPQAFDDETLHRATLFVQEVARTIPAAVRLFEADERASQLEEALVSRSTIDQALGVLMTQNHCTRDTAFGILRRASQNRNVKLRDVAATIIERFTGHPVADPLPFQRPTRPTSQRVRAGVNNVLG
jgi:ANTAR domain